MDSKKYVNSISRGVLVASIITIIASAVLALIMKYVNIGGAENVIYVVLTSLALVVGSVYAAKYHGSKGWIIGLGVGIIFYIVLYVMGVVCGAEIEFGSYYLIKFGLSALVGTLAGMLGINL
ncbi:TIGR04086 family membrane protein [Clostridium sp.]|uniref:TIGR04086 family membrane protein n=1 Tax=Clostridium sp. TaxID=1506 RepID=UPI003F3D7C15